MTVHRRGLTLVEVLVVLAILAVLAAIMTPVLLKARDSARRTESVQLLRQMHQAVQVYRSDYGGTDDVFDGPGAYYALGLPTRLGLDSTLTQLSGPQFRPPCGFDREIFETGPAGGWVNTILYGAPKYDPVYFGPNSNVAYHHYLATFRQNAVLFVDPYCNPPGTKMNDRFRMKRGIAIAISGQIFNRARYGDASVLHWYTDPVRER